MQTKKYIRNSFLIVITIFTLIACKKDYAGDSYDFSNSVDPYVEFLKGVPPDDTVRINVGKDTTVKIQVQVRTAIQDSITVQYTSNSFLAGQGTSFGIKRGTLAGTRNFFVPKTIPLGTVAKITMTSATAQNGSTPVLMGRTGVDKNAIVFKVIDPDE